MCDFGQYGKYIISPSYVHSLLSKPSTPIIDDTPVDETESTTSPMTSQPRENDNIPPYALNTSLPPSASYSHRTTDDVRDTPTFPLLQRCISERLPNQQDQPLQLLWSRTSEHDELRHREGSDLFDLDELSPSASPPPNLVEYTHRHSRSVREGEEEEEDGDKEVEWRRMELGRKRSRKFSWQTLLEDTTNSFMGYMKNISN